MTLKTRLWDKLSYVNKLRLKKKADKELIKGLKTKNLIYFFEWIDVLLIWEITHPQQEFEINEFKKMFKIL